MLKVVIYQIMKLLYACTLVKMLLNIKKTDKSSYLFFERINNYIYSYKFLKKNLLSNHYKKVVIFSSIKIYWLSKDCLVLKNNMRNSRLKKFVFCLLVESQHALEYLCMNCL